MIGRTEIIAIEQAEPRPEEMVSNMEQLDVLRVNGIELMPAKYARYVDPCHGFHGIQTRWLSGPKTTSYHLALEAGRNLFQAAAAADRNFTPAKVVVYHSGGSTPDQIYSSCANRLQEDLGTPSDLAEARDISKGCGSLTDALIVVDRCLRCIAEDDNLQPGQTLYGAVIGGEAIGDLANEPNSIHYLLWGCGGIGLGVRFTVGQRDRGIIRVRTRSLGAYAYLTESYGIGTSPEYYGQRPNSIMGRGGVYAQEVQKLVVGTIAPALEQFVRDCGLDPAAPDLVLCGHNPTYNGAKDFGVAAGFNRDQVISVADVYANTSSVGAFANYRHGRKTGQIRSGCHVFIVGYGAGFDYQFIHYREP